jgi:16S rRNA pseudouridine516 synthase
MPSKRLRLDRFLNKHAGVTRRSVRQVLAQGRVQVDGNIASGISQVIGPFNRVMLDGALLQDKHPLYVMMNKPKGVVSATKDNKHRTVIDLLDRPERFELHIAGRLDFNSTGLILLSNDSRWSRNLSNPENRITKWYRVETEKPIVEEAVSAFSKGMYFRYEDITTLPAQLRIIESHIAQIGLTEGRYHQIKRMFGQFDNKVVALHRQSIGHIQLDATLESGQSRALTVEEIG